MEISQPSNHEIVQLEGSALTLMRAKTLMREVELIKQSFPLSLATVQNNASLANFRNGYATFIDLIPTVASDVIDTSKNISPYTSGFLKILHRKLDALSALLPKLENASLILPISFRERIDFLIRFNAVPLSEISVVKFDHW